MSASLTRYFCELDVASRREMSGTAHRHDAGTCEACDRERAILARFDAIAYDGPTPPLQTGPVRP